MSATSEGRHLAQCPKGLESPLSGELRALGASGIEEVLGGVLFDAKPATAARALVWLRSAVRVLEPVLAGSVSSFDDLYSLVSEARWEDLVGASHTFAVHASVSHAPFTDHHFAALKVKDAVVDRIRKRCGRRPNVDRTTPDVPLRLIVRGERARLYRDLAGSSLHRRGHRPIQVKSPLSEVVAAGLLMLAGWDRQTPLIDPMCGSGTFLFEAAAMATDTAPGLSRRYSAEGFPDADRGLWRELRQEARDRQRSTLAFPILGCDRHPGALGLAAKVAKDSGLERFVDLQQADASTFEPPFAPGTVVCNPPWGGRIGKGDDLDQSWRALGTFLRRCPGSQAFVLSGDGSLTRHLGLRSDRRWPVRIGRFDARWLRYRMRQ